MCLIMGTNRNFCSFFNQKYICFYLFKYYLRNDPFLRTQNDDDDACTLRWYKMQKWVHTGFITIVNKRILKCHFVIKINLYVF